SPRARALAGGLRRREGATRSARLRAAIGPASGGPVAHDVSERSRGKRGRADLPRLAWRLTPIPSPSEMEREEGREPNSLGYYRPAASPCRWRRSRLSWRGHGFSTGSSRRHGTTPADRASITARFPRPDHAF